jgi:hypothetical protein
MVPWPRWYPGFGLLWFTLLDFVGLVLVSSRFPGCPRGVRVGSPGVPEGTQSRCTPDPSSPWMLSPLGGGFPTCIGFRFRRRVISFPPFCFRGVRPWWPFSEPIFESGYLRFRSNGCHPVVVFRRAWFIRDGRSLASISSCRSTRPHFCLLTFRNLSPLRPVVVPRVTFGSGGGVGRPGPAAQSDAFFPFGYCSPGGMFRRCTHTNCVAGRFPGPRIRARLRLAGWLRVCFACVLVRPRSRVPQSVPPSSSSARALPAWYSGYGLRCSCPYSRTWYGSPVSFVAVASTGILLVFTLRFRGRGPPCGPGASSRSDA